jgi:GAF domain-containing protein
MEPAMIYEQNEHIFTPVDEEAPRRVVRLRELGLGERPEPEFDDFARMLATSTNAPLAMVNFVSEDRQYFAGLHAPAMVGPGVVAAADDPARVMTKQQGWCPHVVVRRLPLVLDDVCDYPRFAGNPVVDEFGIRSYLGAPLIDRTGTTLGTICIVDLEPRPWGRPGLEFIKAKAAEMVDMIHERERLHS